MFALRRIGFLLFGLCAINLYCCNAYGVRVWNLTNRNIYHLILTTAGMWGDNFPNDLIIKPNNSGYVSGAAGAKLASLSINMREQIFDTTLDSRQHFTVWVTKDSNGSIVIKQKKCGMAVNNGNETKGLLGIGDCPN